MYVTCECSRKDFESSSLHGIHVKHKWMSRDGSQHTTYWTGVHKSYNVSLSAGALNLELHLIISHTDPDHDVSGELLCSEPNLK